MCPGLGHGLVEALMHFGTEEQKAKYLPNIISGKWTGTMCLTEPQCGTDLGLMRTKAVPDGDGYLLTGTKIWITFGEHDLAENIVHLVLARLPDAPDGIKGVSLFVVPKFLDNGERNPVYCGGLEHKMGIHASPTCVINLEAAKGYLVGEPHKGMKGMFVMMNHARLGVGLEGIALSEIAYQTAVAFCKDRRQGRSLNKERNDANSAADNILVHPDVRRQLLNVRASTEGMRALTLWTAIQIDIAHAHEDEQTREQAKGLVELMTPVIKAYCTERGFENVSEAMQVTGGSGYTTDWCIEQYLRDARIAMIYEGTNHVQALDLIGRKLPKGGGALYRAFSKEVYKYSVANKDVYGMGEFASALEGAINALNETTMNLGMKGMADPEAAAAVASNYLKMFGIISVAYMWARMAEKALSEESRFNMTKLKMARYYFNQVLPEIDSIRRVINAGKDHMMAFEPSEF
jgi:alkylation response protein AidB-like acyl-CoA dehydrogenase